MKLIFQKQGFALEHQGKTLLQHSPENPLLYVGVGKETVHMYRGNFQISDHVTERTPLRTMTVETQGDTTLLHFGTTITASLTIQNDCATLKWTAHAENINRFWLRVPSHKEEKLFGLGEQMSYLNLKGRNFPIFTSEPGVGRDKSTYITWKSDVDAMAGGDYYNTNYPQPTYISSNLYYLHMDSTAYGEFNFKEDDFTEIQLWEVPQETRIQGGSSYLDLVEKLTAFMGRQAPLPNWVYEGLILGVQGGERSFALLEQSLEKGIKVSGLWCQDWCGKRVTSFGKRLQWDWQFHPEMYPELPKRIEELHQRGIKFLGYINPYLVNDGALYQEGAQKGYFAKKSDGSDYLVDFGEFDCGVVDLTNPEAYQWFKDDVIKKYSIDIGIDGWMADFGEYLPTDDIVLHSGLSPMIAHNQWPVLWAKCNYDAVRETNNVENILYFMRAGGSGTGKYCSLLWAGDQSVDFSLHDGLATVIPAALSAGMSGMGLSHSDIGGYTSLYDNCRDKELFQRWTEMAAFTPVMRTHEGNRPETNFQYYDCEETMTFLAKFVDIYTMISPYIRALVEENSERGIPVQRPLFLHYPEDENTYQQQYQYLLGEEVLVAPVHEKEKDTWTVYLPEGTWIHLFTGKEYGKGSVEISAPLGCPPVFFQKDSKHSDLFQKVLEKYPCH